MKMTCTIPSKGNENVFFLYFFLLTVTGIWTSGRSGVGILGYIFRMAEQNDRMILYSEKKKWRFHISLRVTVLTLELFCKFVASQSLSHVRLFVTPMDCNTPGFPVLHYLLEFVQTHVH